MDIKRWENLVWKGGKDTLKQRSHESKN
jgi:hypothetical protein